MYRRLERPRDRRRNILVDRWIRNGAQPRTRHPPRLSDRLRATGQAHRPERADPAKAPDTAVQQLAAPDRSVEPVPGAVEDRPDRSAGLPVLGEAGREMRVVVLDAGELDVLELERVLGREVLGV